MYLRSRSRNILPISLKSVKNIPTFYNSLDNFVDLKNAITFIPPFEWFFPKQFGFWGPKD